jgi:hypothetical protein
MKNVKLELTVEELLLVTTLISDQLFRQEFIDPKCQATKETRRSWRWARIWFSA